MKLNGAVYKEIKMSSLAVHIEVIVASIPQEGSMYNRA